LLLVVSQLKVVCFVHIVALLAS